jgi:hypothetical protein
VLFVSDMRYSQQWKFKLWSSWLWPMFLHPKIECITSYETLVTTYKTMWRHNPKDHNLYFKLVTCFGICWISDFIGLGAHILKILAHCSHPHSQLLSPHLVYCAVTSLPLLYIILFIIWSGCSSKHLLICSLTDYFKWLYSDVNSVLLPLVFHLTHSRI